jgi:glycosyltransferase involved in cell wall biosynthesis
MTILFFTRLFHPHVGGVEKHVLNVSKLLIKAGYRVCVVAEKHDAKLKEKEKYQGIFIYRISVTESEHRKKYEIWKWIFSHMDLIRYADIIHCHDVFFWYLPFRFIFPAKKIYVTFHGYEGNSLPTMKARIMHKIAEKLSRGNICVGDYLAKWYGTKPTYVTYGAVDPHNVKAGSLKLQNPLKILFVGRLEPETSIMGYLEICRILQRKGVKFLFTIVGDGALRKQAEDFAQKHNLPAKFIGSVQEVDSYYKQASFVFSSRYLSTLEAFINKKYVFCLCNNELHQDCFRLSPFANWLSLRNNSSDLAKDVLQYIENPFKKKDVIESAYRFVRRQSWSNMVELYEKLWQIP